MILSDCSISLEFSDPQQLAQLTKNQRNVWKPVELFESVTYTGIFLGPESRKFLLNCFPLPTTWTKKADHVTINLGKADYRILRGLGQLGEKILLRVYGFGELPEKIKAVRVEHAVNPEIQISSNYYPHITLGLAKYLGVKSRESNDIKEWYNIGEPLLVSGLIAEKTQWMVREIRQNQDDTSAANKPQEVSIGDLVKKHHPELKGMFIGLAVNGVKKWMKENGVQNKAENLQAIEEFVASMAEEDDGHNANTENLSHPQVKQEADAGLDVEALMAEAQQEFEVENDVSQQIDIIDEQESFELEGTGNCDQSTEQDSCGMEYGPDDNEDYEYIKSEEVDMKMNDGIVTEVESSEPEQRNASSERYVVTDSEHKRNQEKENFEGDQTFDAEGFTMENNDKAKSDSNIRH